MPRYVLAYLLICSVVIVSGCSSEETEGLTYQDGVVAGDLGEVSDSEPDQDDDVGLEDSLDVAAEDSLEDTPLEDSALDDTGKGQDQFVMPEDVPTPFEDVGDVSPIVRTCLDLALKLCDTILPACANNELVGPFITPELVVGCLNLLASTEQIAVQLCEMLEQGVGQNETVDMILAMGGADFLMQCVDNFDCTNEQIQKIYQALAPLLQGGGEFDVTKLLDLYLELCI